jgi:hypothetical protein
VLPGMHRRLAKLSFPAPQMQFLRPLSPSYHEMEMGFPIKICSVCGEEFELKPDKPGFANQCPECSTAESAAPTSQRRKDADERKTAKEANEARRQAMRELLYRKDS